MQPPNLIVCEFAGLASIAIVAVAMTDAEVSALIAAQPGRALLVYQLAGGTVKTVGAPHEPLPEKKGVPAKKKARR